MSCWVVPTIAAELWGVPVDQILQQIKEGKITHRLDEGFMFVDVAPNSPTMARPGERPATYTMIEAEADESENPGSMEMDEQDNESSRQLGDWQNARQRVGVSRTP